MSIFDWTTGIKILFDRPIITEVEAAIGTEEVRSYGTVIVSGSNASYPANNAFDKSTGTYWRSSSTTAGQWIGFDYGSAKTISKMRVNMSYSSGRINAYKIQGSDNNSDWTDIASGNFANSSSWQEVTFDSATFRYFRLYAASKYSSYYTVSELEFYSTRSTYNVAGWTVSANEPDMSPNGTVTSKNYTIRRLTRAESNYAVVIWLELTDRMKHPQGDVTVNFSGTLQGPGGAFVAPFSLSFTPQNLTPFFNPNEEVATEITSVLADVELTRIYRSSNPYYEELTSELTGAGISVVRTHIDDLEN